MNIFKKFFISALFYLLFFFSIVVCRISDKRKCADADCSQPVSLATTLIRYNADDERLMSFPPNLKLKVFSKDAGDNPNFWEVEINGKRGYVPKGLLRETRVLIPPSKLTHIVPTGRVDSLKPNTTNENDKNPESNSANLLSATPKLPAANSKGFFSTIGEVSADSVPMNSPDIKPQTTRKFQVFDGTTVYDDVVNEKPESPPTIIDDPVNRESQEKLLDPKDVPDNVPLSDIKPVTEHIDESVGKNEPVVEDGDEVKEKENDEQKVREEVQPEEVDGGSPGGIGFMNIGGYVNQVVNNLISSGAGEDVTEEELELEEVGEEEEDEGEEEGVVEEEENYENEEVKSKTEEEISVGATVKNSAEDINPEEQNSVTSHAETSKAPELINVIDKTSSDLSPGDAPKAKEFGIANLDEEELPSSTTDGKDDYKVTNESLVGQSIINENIEGKHQAVEQDNVPIISIEEEEPLKTIKVDGVAPNHIQDSDEALNDVEIEEKSLDNEITIDRNKEQLRETPESESDTVVPNVQDQIATDEPQGQEETKTEEIKIEVDPKSDTSQLHEQVKTDELPVSEDVKEPHNQVETKTDEPQKNNETLTEIPLPHPPTRQFLHGSGPNEGSQDNVYKSSETPQPVDDLKSETESANNTAEDNLDNPTLSSLPKMPYTVSPKYSAVITRRIQSSESSSVSEIPSHSEEIEDADAQLDDTFEAKDIQTEVPIQDDGMPTDSIHQSNSPKYSSIVNSRIGPLTPSSEVRSEMPSEAVSEVKTVFTGSSDVVSTTEEKPSDESTAALERGDAVKQIDEVEPKEEITAESNQVVPQDSQQPTPSDDVTHVDIVNESLGSPDEIPVHVDEDTQVPLTDVIEETLTSNEDVVGATQAPHAKVVEEAQEETVPEEGMFTWVASLLDLFGSQDSSSSEEASETIESMDTSSVAHLAEETCSVGGVDGSCPMAIDATQKEVTWQEASYSDDMWELLDKVPLEATIWLIITAVVVLIFSLGHYYIEAHRRDGPLVAIINKLEREVLILKKERCILEDRLNIAEQQLEAWNTSSTENDALLIELKQELEETKLAKAELEEQAAQLKEELESVTESGLEMHRLLEESLSSQDGSQVLLSTVETLREKLQRQEDEISGLSDTLLSKNAEVEELQAKLAQSADVARSLEDKVIAVSREKEEELLQLRDKHRQLISQLEEVMETKALDETRLSTEMSKLRLTIEELQKTLAERDSELDTLKEVVKQLRATDSNEKIEALFDVVSVQSKLKTAVAERDDYREKFLEEEGARKLLEGHMKKITQEVAELKNSFETAEKEKIEALTKLQVLSNYFKEKESQLQKELGLQESMWLQKQSDDHTIYEQMRSLREENEKYKLQNESLKKEIVEQEASFKIQLANTEQKAHENWVASRQAERRVKEAQQEAAQLRNRLTAVEKNANYSLDEKANISESNGDPSSPPPSLMYPPTTSPPFMMYGPPIPPPGDFVPPPPLMGSPYPSDSRPPPLGRISSPPLDHRFSPPPPLPYGGPYDYSYGHHSPSPPPPLPSHHRNVHKPQPREMSREQKDHVPIYSPEAEKTSRRNKR